MRARPQGGVRTTALFAFVAVVCVAALGAALVSQHVYDMQPCPWCVLQRLIFPDTTRKLEAYLQDFGR